MTLRFFYCLDVGRPGGGGSLGSADFGTSDYVLSTVLWAEKRKEDGASLSAKSSELRA